MKNRLIFTVILDLCAKFEIVREISVVRYRPRVELYIKKADVLVFIHEYLKNNLPNVHVKFIRQEAIYIDDNKNVLPLLLYIRDDLQFQRNRVNTLIDFIRYRTQSNKKRYTVVDHEFYVKMRGK